MSTEQEIPKESDKPEASPEGDSDPAPAAPDADASEAATQDAASESTPIPTDPEELEPSEPPKPLSPPKDHENVYHLCRKQHWEDAKEYQIPYFPQTFEEDGNFTRASLYLDDIADVANLYYSKDSPPDEEWIVLEIDIQFLYHGLGIPVMAATESIDDEGESEYLKVLGGLSTHPKVLEHLVTAVYSMKRRDVDGKFVGMLLSKWLTEDWDTSMAESEAEVDDIVEIPTEDSPKKKPKKKKKGLFKKLTSKKSASADV